MNKKKVLLTVLLSVILTLLIVCYVIEYSKKPMPIDNMPTLTETQTQEKFDSEKSDAFNNKEDMSLKQLQLKKNKNKNNSKHSTVLKQKTVIEKKEEKNTENSLNIFEEKIEENVPTQEVGIVVPVNYVSQNPYKYIYTPKKYPQKK